MLGVANGDGECVGRVGRRRGRGRQQHPHHHRHLPLFRVARADNGLLDQVGGIFGHRQAGKRQGRERDPARLAQLQRRLRVPVDECLLDRRLMRPLAFDEPGQQAMDRRQPLGERSRRVGLDRAAANEAEPRAGSLDHAPARRAQAGVDAENANHADGHGEGLIYEFRPQGILAHGWPRGAGPAAQYINILYMLI